MIFPIRERRDFQRLSSDGTRIRSSTLWCSCYPNPDSTATLVAFALSRRLGPAVTRNRLRRRLRALLREADRGNELPAATMLIGASPRAIEQTFDQLSAEVSTLLTRTRLVCSD